MSTTAVTPATASILKHKAVVADVQPGVPVRPGTVTETTYDIHDGVVKAKHLKPKQNVRPFLHGAPRGKVRVIDHVERIDDGAMVRVFFADGTDDTYKAAYRWHDVDLAGSAVASTKQVPAFVPVR